MPSARAAKEGILLWTISEDKTSLWVVVAPIVIVSPLSLIKFSSLIS